MVCDSTVGGIISLSAYQLILVIKNFARTQTDITYVPYM